MIVDLYLSDIPKLKEHPYILAKMKEDSLVYAESLFLAKMTRKNFLSQLRQVDNGDNSARMHEVVNQTIGQMRENSKFLMGQRTEFEKFYKTLRKDLGFNEIENEEINPQKIVEELKDSKDEDGDITDNRKLNDLIKLAMINKDKEKQDKKKR